MELYELLRNMSPGVGESLWPSIWCVCATGSRRAVSDLLRPHAVRYDQKEMLKCTTSDLLALPPFRIPVNLQVALCVESQVVPLPELEWWDGSHNRTDRFL